MNKHGQVLVALVIIFPLLLIIFGGIIELYNLEYNKKRIESVTKTILEEEYDTRNENNIYELFESNNIKGNIDIISNEDLEIKVDTKIDSIFGKLINKDKYDINVDIIGYQEEGKIKFKKGV